MTHESHNVEFKQGWRDEYLKWICGFANADGGTILIGKDDDGRTVGVSNAKQLMEDIPNKIQMNLGIVCDVRSHVDGTDEYIEIAVDPSPYPVNYHGEFHYRSGATKQVLKGNALTRFIFDRTGLSWESVKVGDLEDSGVMACLNVPDWWVAPDHSNPSEPHNTAESDHKSDFIGLYRTLSDFEASIVSLMEEKPTITLSEVAERLGVARSTVALRVSDLRERNIVHRAGSRKTGHWTIDDIKE